jgi:hypothetical protein
MKNRMKFIPRWLLLKSALLTWSAYWRLIN